MPSAIIYYIERMHWRSLWGKKNAAVQAAVRIRIRIPSGCAPCVINMRTCRSMGCISDLEIDCCTGCILALVVPGPGRLCWFLGRDFEFFIPWRCVIQIGADIILVDVEEEKCKKRCG